MTTTPLPHPFAATLDAFLRSLLAKNRTPATLAAYRSDVGGFLAWLTETTLCDEPRAVTRAEITDYLAELGEQQLAGVSRARKLAAIREYFRYLVDARQLAESPAEAIATPRREKRGRTYCSEEAYTRLLALAGGTPRDYAILQVFLQTGVRVSELACLAVDDVDLDRGLLRVTGKGMKDREIPLPKKAIAALKLWLAARPAVAHRQLFTNRYDEPITPRGVQKLVARYRRGAGLEKRITPHSLRHTFATQKRRRGLDPFELRDLMGHESIATTQIYVHLDREDAKKRMEATSL
jgi:site-specific recombinase XerD